MKKPFLKIVAGISVFLLLVACPKEEAIFEPTNADLTVYKNQTGDANANALQAQHKNTEGALNFYGNFDVDNNPTTIHTLTYQKANNDTIVHLMMDPITGKLAASYITVNGVKSNIIVKFDYPSATHLSVSFHQYDWSKNTSDLMYGVNLEIPKEIGAKSSSLAYDGSIGWKESVAAGLVITEVGIAISGGATLTGAVGSGIGILAGIASTTILTAAAPVAAVAAATGIIAILIPSDAFSAELTPSDLPYPGDVPINNPVTPEENPTSKLTPFDCSGTSISFKPVLYLDGTIVIEEIKGGVFPYTYMVNDEVRDFPIFPNNYKNGSYLLSIKDANGCISCFLAALKKPANCEESTLALSTTTTSNSATANATGGQTPYEYVWNNGSIGATINNLTDGVYTVTVTDQYGCTAVSYAIIESACEDVTDIDGNVYPSVKIGAQCWMQKNLNVSHYRNGDVIPQVTDATAWENLSTGAWCYYENNAVNGTTYGKLYNWYAVNDARGLAPDGWHVASDAEWTTLTTYLGGENVAGGKMKTTSGWDSPNTGASNESGFSALAGGYRRSGNGTFVGAGNYGDWWSSTQGNSNRAYNRSLYYDGSFVSRNDYYKSFGRSVRCLRD